MKITQGESRCHRRIKKGLLVPFAGIGILFIFLSIPLYVHAEHMMKMGAIRLPGNMATDFTLPSLDKDPVTLSDLRGKVVMINFWTTWCHACEVEMPSMERLYGKYKDKGFTVLAVDIEEKPEVVRKFVKKYHLTFPVLLDSSGAIKSKYLVTGIPTSFLVDKTGRLVAKFWGERDWDETHAAAILEELLGE